MYIWPPANYFSKQNEQPDAMLNILPLRGFPFVIILRTMMINFYVLTLLFWGVSKYLVKYYSECFCEGVVVDEINIWISRLSKVDCPSYCGWASFNLLKAGMEQKSCSSHKKAVPLMNKQNSSYLPDWIGTSIFSFLQAQTETSVLLGFQACQPSDCNYTIGASTSPLCELQILSPVGLHSHTRQFLIKMNK